MRKDVGYSLVLVINGTTSTDLAAVVDSATDCVRMILDRLEVVASVVHDR